MSNNHENHEIDEVVENIHDQFNIQDIAEDNFLDKLLKSFLDNDEVDKKKVKEVKRIEALANSFARVFEVVNRILLGTTQVKVIPRSKVSHNLIDTPAWTDGEDIFLNTNVIGKSLNNMNNAIDFDKVAEVKGLNYHELAHICYTPRMNYKIVKEVRSLCDNENTDDYWYAFNILEDMKAETFMVHVYPKMIDYFTVAVMQYIVKLEDKDQLKASYLLTNGRKFLPIELLIQLRSMYENTYGSQILKSLEDITKKYLHVNYSRVKFQEGLNLIMRFKTEVLDAMDKKNPQGGRPSLINGSRHAQGRNAGMRSTSGQWISSHHKTEDGNMTKGIANSSDTKDVLRNIDQLLDEVDKLLNDDELKEEVLKDIANQRALQTIDTINGNYSKGKNEVYAVRETVKDMLQQVKEGYDFNQDVEVTRKSVTKTLDKALEDIEIEGFVPNSRNIIQSTNEVLNTSNKIIKSLRKLKNELDSDWLRTRPSGVLDVNEVIKAKASRVPKTKIFKSWKPSNEDLASCEVVILLDMSGSMEFAARSASETVHILKYALDKVGVRTTVLGFANDTYKLYLPNEKVNKNEVKLFSTHGSTYPEVAIRQANRIAEVSKANNTIFICVTDGAWNNSTKEVENIKKTFDLFDYKKLFYFGSEDSFRNIVDDEIPTMFSKIKSLKQINELNEVVVYVHEIVTEIIRKHT